MKYPLILGLLFLIGCSSPRTDFKLTPSKSLDLVAIAVKSTRVHLDRPQNGVIPMERMRVDEYGPVVAHTIEGAFVNSGLYDVVERQDIDSLKQEMALGQDDVWFNQSDVSQPGSLRGARFIILSEARIRHNPITGTTISLQVRVTDVTTGRFVQQFWANGYSMSPNMNIAIDKCLASLGENLEKQIKRSLPPS